MDTFDEIETAAQAEEEAKKKKKGGKEEAGAIGHSEVIVSQGFYEKMGLMGAPAHLVAEVLKNWRHLQGQGLMQRLIDFATGKARASAHAEVQIEQNKDFGLIHNLFQHLKTLPRTLTHQVKHDHQNRSGPGM